MERIACVTVPTFSKVSAYVVLNLILLYGGNFVLSQESLCDPLLEPSVSPTDPLGYRTREDRCEGIYIQEVASGALHVVSFTQVFEDFELDSQQPLLVTWDAPPLEEPQAVRLRAEGVRRRLYYRMDTVRPSDAEEYVWPLGVLRALGIAKADIGVVGWMPYPIVRDNLYLPLRVRQGKDIEPSASYSLGLLPDAELAEVYLSLATISADGQPDTFLRDGEELGHGFYPAGRLISVPIAIADLESPGVYFLEISATLQRGGSSVLQLWFYHAD